jgi:PKD repeat protein
LTAANISTSNSTDRGQTFTKNPAGNVTGGIPADDRQWMEFLGKDSVYLIYRTLEPAIALVQRSNDGGFSYGPAREVGTIGQVGGVSVDQNDGTVYIAGGNGIIAVGTPASPGAEPLTYTLHNVVGAGNAHLFFTVKAAKDGTVYVCYSDDHNVFIRWSKDKGNTWSPGVRVSDGPETATSIVPWMETGPTPGSIGVVWYGTTASSNNDNADWKVFFAQSLNATDASPVFRQVELSDHFIHGSNISEGGLPITPGAAPNRNLLDYFQIGFDPTGAAVVAYTDDHNDFDGNVYVARQISGPGVKGTDVPAPIPGSGLPQPSPRPADAPQVTDYAQDSKTGLLTILPLNDPLDILSVKYSTEGTASNPVLVATMKVSDLSIVPPLSNWRMNFTANAPDSRMSPTGDYSFGLSDRGDQFFVRATTDALGTKTYTYGTAIREHQHRGFVAYTDVGAADSGSFDSTAGTITVKISLSKLNATLAAGRTPIGPGSILAGLRAGTFTTGDDNPADRNDRAKSDLARGGTQYAINSAPTAALTANPTSGAPPLLVNFDGSGSSDPDAGDRLTYTFDFGDGSAPVTQATPTVAHTYTQLNKFTASLTVKDQLGFTSNTATVQIDVTNRVPTAALTATPTSGYAPLPVNFDGSGSSDPDAGDSVASYTFDFGDGAVVTQSGAKIAHTYNAGGIYTAKLTVADTHGGTSTNGAQVQITVNNRPTTDCMEDDDSRITYSDGWHNGTSVNASAGHFRWHQGKSASHTASVDFSVPASGTGVFSYRYAKSTKGGTAEVFIDGVSRGTLSYKGTAGSDKSPEFGTSGVPYEARYEGLSAGTHRFELRNMSDSVFVDGFCLTITVAPQAVTSSGGSGGGTTTPSSFNGTPTSGPGQSTSNDSSVNSGQESKSNVTLGTNARALSIVAETSGNLPVKLALVSPTGLTLQIVDAVNGVAVLTTPVTQGGIYTVKVINVNLGPVQVWTVATPTVAR